MEKYINEIQEKIYCEERCINDLNKRIATLRNKEYSISAEQSIKKRKLNETTMIMDNFLLEKNKRTYKLVKNILHVLEGLMITSVVFTSQTFIPLILIGTTAFTAIKSNGIKKRIDITEKKLNKNDVFSKKQEKEIKCEIEELENRKNCYSSRIKILKKERDIRKSKKEIYENKLQTIDMKRKIKIQEEPAKIIELKKYKTK